MMHMMNEGNQMLPQSNTHPEMINATPLPHRGRIRKYHVTLLLPIDALGLVIGKGGVTLKKIADESGARIQLQEHSSLVPNAKNRSMKLSGPIEAIEAAEKIILKQLGRRKPKGYRSEDDEESEHLDDDTTKEGLPNDSDPGKTTENQRSSSFSSVTETSSTHDTNINNTKDKEINGTDTSKDQRIDDEEETKDADDQITVRWIIDNSKIGHLIGKVGVGIKEINAASGAWVKVAHSMEMPPGSTERLVSIMGQPENVEKARQMIEAKVEGRLCGDDMPVSENNITLFVPAMSVGFIMGEKATNLDDIYEETGAKIHFTDAADIEMGSTENKITFHGLEESQAKAKALVEDKVKEWKENMNYQKDPEDFDFKLSSIKIAIPEALFKHVIGKSGSKVKEIMQSTNVLVKMLSKEPSVDKARDEKPVLIIGTVRAMLDAQKLILDRINEAPSFLLDQAFNRSRYHPRARRFRGRNMNIGRGNGGMGERMYHAHPHDRGGYNSGYHPGMHSAQGTYMP